MLEAVDAQTGKASVLILEKFKCVVQGLRVCDFGPPMLAVVSLTMHKELSTALGTFDTAAPMVVAEVPVYPSAAIEVSEFGENAVLFYSLQNERFWYTFNQED